MAKLSITEEKKLNQLLKEREKITQKIISGTKIQASTREKVLKYEYEITKLEEKQARSKEAQLKIDKAQAAIGKKTKSLTTQMNKLLKTGAGEILKQTNFTKDLDKTMQLAKGSTGEIQQGYNLIAEAQLQAAEDLKNGTFDAIAFTADLEEQFAGLGEEAQAVMGNMTDDLVLFAEEAKKTGEKLGDALAIDAKSLDGLDEMRAKAKQFSGIMSSKKLMGAAALGAVVKLITDFAGKVLEVRQSLGTSAVESARLAGNMKAAGVSAKLVGGSSSEAEAAVTSLGEEFGSLSVVSAGVSAQLGLITGQFGLSGANAGKLLKSMQSINGASIETNLNLIGVVGSLARAEGVAPAAVLNDIAENTETFAQFAKDGGVNIGKAALQARKLGLNLGTVAGIAESLLDFESSIEKQMEASVLLGRQINTDKARELALTGDLEGLAKEVKNQVGSQADFEAMNVVQRKALAEAMGVTVSDLGKIIAGEQTSAQIAEQAQKSKEASLGKQQGLEIALASAAAGTAAAQLAGAIPAIMKSFAKFPFGIGIPLGIAAVGSMFGLVMGAKSAVGLETGGEVKETGMAVVHKGESIAGTQFGGRESNNLLKELIKQNSTLMGRLTNKVGDLALSS